MRIGECFAARFARVWPFAGVRTLMLDTTAKVRKTTITIFACVWLLASMCAHMPIQFEIDNESFAAYITFKWFFIAMSSHMTER